MKIKDELKGLRSKFENLENKLEMADKHTRKII